MMRARPLLLPLLLALVAAAAGARALPVSGRLASPAGSVPALTVYAWSLGAAKLYSVATEEGQASFTLDLPPGRYYLFAAPLEPGAPPVYGAYTAYAACMHEPAHADCQDHALRTLAVGRQPPAPVELTDWYLDEPVTQSLDRILGRREEAPPEAELAAPRFSEYPAAPAPATRATELAGAEPARLERDRDALAPALAGAPNFAGRGALVRLGCGSGCEAVALIDLPSGRVDYPPPLAQLPAPDACAPGEALRFRRDSRLLTVTEGREHARVTRYFVWDPEHGSLKLVATLSSALEEQCATPR